MTIRTLKDIEPTHKLSAPMTVKTKTPITFSKFPETACVIPVGTTLEVRFSETNPAYLYYEYNGSLRVATVVNAYKRFTGFRKCPSLKSIQKLEWDGGACMTPTGHKVEPDGHGPDGSPAWMLVLGVI